MISITCTNCKTLLTIDEAFAGGVCRCRHCGTIQTVPSRLKETAGAAKPAAAAAAAAAAGKGEDVAAAAPQGAPSFCGVALDEPSVIYLLDRGNATQQAFDALKSACNRSVASLGPTRKFQVIFWDNDSDPALYP